MNARKLPSGSWRARLFLGEDEQGKKHYKSFTAPTKREAEKLALTYEAEQAKANDISFGKAYENYIALKSNILSPSTLRGYRQMESYFKEIKDIRVSDIDQETVKAFINKFAGKYSPKTTRNCYSLLCAVIRSEIPNADFKITLPQKEVLTYYIPKDQEIKKILDYTKEKNYDLYIAILLASIGTLRRSEICGLTISDVDGNIVHIHNVVVKGPDKEWVLKQVPKNSTSDRYVEYPDFVIAELPKEGKLCNLNPDRITNEFGRALKKLELPHFRFHDLRHYAATIMHAMGVPEAYVMERGGWKTNTTLNQVYRGTRSDFSKKYAAQTNAYFGKHLS